MFPVILEEETCTGTQVEYSESVSEWYEVTVTKIMIINLFTS